MPLSATAVFLLVVHGERCIAGRGPGEQAEAARASPAPQLLFLSLPGVSVGGRSVSRPPQAARGNPPGGGSREAAVPQRWVLEARLRAARSVCTSGARRPAAAGSEAFPLPPLEKRNGEPVASRRAGRCCRRAVRSCRSARRADCARTTTADPSWGIAFGGRSVAREPRSGRNSHSQAVLADSKQRTAE